MRPLTFSGWRLPIELSLFASDRVSDKDRLAQMQGVHDGKNIVAETVGRIIVVIGSGIAGLAKAATGNAVHVVLAGELRREVVINMRGVAQTGEENKRASAAAPIEHLEVDAGLDGDEPHRVW